MIKRILSLIFAVLMIFSVSVCAFAHEVPDPDRTGSITITVTYEGKPVSGGYLTIYKVGNVVSDNGNYGFEFTEDFAECSVPITEINSSELPEALAKIVEEKRLEGTTERIGSNGQVKFENLEHGLYLAVQYIPAYGFSKINPFLISVPYYENDHYVYDVDASPKVELEPKPFEPEDPPEEPEDPPEDELPDTGLTSWPVPVMAVSGAVFICAGIILRRFERKNK